MWGEDVDWSAFARLRGVPPLSIAKDLYPLLRQFRTLEMTLGGLTVYDPCGYVMFVKRFCAKKVAEAFVQCSETLEVKWIMPKVLLPKGSAYLEQISEEEWANIGSFLFRCYGNLLSETSTRAPAPYGTPGAQ